MIGHWLFGDWFMTSRAAVFGAVTMGWWLRGVALRWAARKDRP